jgi:hypothetical protein
VSAPFAGAAEQEGFAGEEVRVVAVGPITAAARPRELPLATELARLAARTTTWPGLGRYPPDSLRLLVVPDERAFVAVSGGRVPHWGAGLAVPGTRTIVLRADAGDLPRTLRHELAHLALHEAVDVRVPLWFDEGYATWAAGGTAGFDQLAVNLAVLRGEVGDFRTLDGALRGAAPAAGAAYPLAATAVEELARRHPDGSLRPLLARLAGGEDFALAVRRTTGLTLPQFEEAWRRSVRRRFGILTFSVAGGIWLLVALMVLAAPWLRRRLDRPRRAALDHGWVVPPEEPPDQPPGAEPGGEAGDPPELDPTARRL